MLNENGKPAAWQAKVVEIPVMWQMHMLWHSSSTCPSCPVCLKSSKTSPVKTVSVCPQHPPTLIPCPEGESQPIPCKNAGEKVEGVEEGEEQQNMKGQRGRETGRNMNPPEGSQGRNQPAMGRPKWGGKAGSKQQWGGMQKARQVGERQAREGGKGEGQQQVGWGTEGKGKSKRAGSVQVGGGCAQEG